MPKRRKQGKRRAVELQAEKLKEAVVLIPLTYNDGTKVPRDVLDAIHDEILDGFNGWTIEGTVKGAYRMQSGQKVVEKLEKVSIVLRGSRLSELERMISRWAAILGQETMLLKVSDFKAKLIRPQSGEEPP